MVGTETFLPSPIANLQNSYRGSASQAEKDAGPGLWEFDERQSGFTSLEPPRDDSNKEADEPLRLIDLSEDEDQDASKKLATDVIDEAFAKHWSQW